MNRNRRLWFKAAIISIALASAAMTARAAVFFHAALLRSKPSADAKLKEAPKDIRLVFSEEIVPSLSQIVLIGPAGDSSKLKVSNDPHDVHTLVGVIATALGSGGRYSVYWRVVSADGHLVDGTFSYSVAGPVATAAKSPVVTATDTSAARKTITQPRAANDEVPVVAALARGLGLGALMAAVGLLFFGPVTGRSDVAFPRPLIRWLAVAGAALLVVHLAAWLTHLGGTSQDETFFISSVLRTKLGRIELLRTGLAFLTLIFVLLRRDWVAFLFGVACLIVSGAVGHPAAIDPIWAIPGKSLHLLGGALWLGGLLWLLCNISADRETRRTEALKVSSLALVAVIAVALSGLLQTVLFLNAPADLVGSTYGKLVIAKIVGVVILIGYGAYNRFRVLPRYATGGEIKLRRSVKQEVFVISLLVLIGGFLAYVAPPPSTASSTTVTRGTE